MTQKKNIQTLNSIINKLKINPNHSKIEIDILESIYNLSCNFFEINAKIENVQTIASIARSFFDYYSVHYLLFEYGNDDEKKLRQKLYLCDGYNTFLKTLTNFKEIDSENLLKNSIETSKISLENIKNTIPENYNIYCTEKHINEYRWKFKSNEIFKDYSWKELYELSLGRKILSSIIANYFSLYTHGLSIQSIKIENDNFLNATLGIVDNAINSLNLNLLYKYFS